MGIFEVVWKVSIYILIMLLFLILAKRRGGKYFKKTSGNMSLFPDKISYSYLSIFILSTLVGWYSGWQFPSTSDRENYAFRFMHDFYVDGTYGLRWVSQFLRGFTDNPQVYFFFVSFLCVFIFLIVINKYKIKTKLPIILLVSSTLIPSTFYLLKQAPALAFASLAIAMFFNKKMSCCILLTIIAILFHESAVILIPLYIIMIGAKKTWIRIIEYALFIAVLFFFPQIVQAILPIVNSVDYIGSQTGGFEVSVLSQQGIINLLTVIKGLPIYMITAYALFNRKRLKTRIDDYDKFFIICCVGSICILLSTYMYWMFRFAMYCYIPVYIFAGLIYQNIKSANEQVLFILFIAGPLIFFTLRFLFQIYI